MGFSFNQVAESVDSQTNEIGYDIAQLGSDVYKNRDPSQFNRRYTEIVGQLESLKLFVDKHKAVIERGDNGEYLQENSMSE